MKRVFILTILVFIAALAAQAAEWTCLPKSKTGHVLCYDAASIVIERRANDGYVDVWWKLIGPTGDHWLCRDEFYWKAHVVRYGPHYRYDKDGNMIHKTPAAAEWEEIIPDSAAEVLYSVLFPPPAERRKQ